MIEALKEEMKISVKEMEKKTNKNWNKSVNLIKKVRKVKKKQTVEGKSLRLNN